MREEHGGLSAFIKKTPENPLAPSTMRGHRQPASQPSLDIESTDALILDFRPPEV